MSTQSLSPTLSFSDKRRIFEHQFCGQRNQFVSQNPQFDNGVFFKSSDKQVSVEHTDLEDEYSRKQELNDKVDDGVNDKVDDGVDEIGNDAVNDLAPNSTSNSTSKASSNSSYSTLKSSALIEFKFPSPPLRTPTASDRGSKVIDNNKFESPDLTLHISPATPSTRSSSATSPLRIDCTSHLLLAPPPIKHPETPTKRPPSKRKSLLHCTATPIQPKPGMCPACRVMTKMQDSRLIVNGKIYHAECYRCHGCNLDFGTTHRSYSHGGIYYCKPCFQRNFGKCCFKCNHYIENGDAFLQVKDRYYHPDHFSCTSCDSLLFADDSRRKVLFFERESDGLPHCNDCYIRDMMEKSLRK